MADKNRPDGTGETGRGKQHEPDIRDDDLERRRRELEASLATRLPNRLEGKDDAKAGSAAGYGQAVKLSSEFIAGVVVGAGIGWIIDRMAGTSPWGLIVFLLLGFGAGVLNVMRSAGVVAEFGQGDKSRSGRDDSK
ncbi:ATP F0F1 synthase subunit I [Mesorhizobium sp. WSM4312]|uniref:AtpZ/AtpI family protein n=1 Tax=unclassified Mesorhizobium TaxID=325217 RepID=UPI000BAEF4D6|nr:MULTISPECIES: AtpZ/AtpI family protein [unclassified Mesorhizobium]PBB70383.1 ATP F0F1 synthase subunit I [Mesorhizobium sp. WSM4312]PBC23991.1 ATP F0F1 synthase subunit I [Mesorhizobium sp. WSM4311]TRC79731.1 ATP F0F1 synthase subunit I [Mesorhizobium sp. WSM4315]TRC88608.1 ATP F0F1 synthase subunit I [Mesorhizobium sp. WSM4307]TRD05667.1 ATP F0F1 synthase subunit I [Mesorhizobium sp. WSM4305]